MPRVTIKRNDLVPRIEYHQVYLVRHDLLCHGGIMEFAVDLTRVSSRGQIVIPLSIRKGMHLDPGTKMLVVAEGENIMMKPIKRDGRAAMASILKKGEKIAKRLNLRPGDIAAAIKQVRNENRP
jgi:AbrB family looped-hinge helix DNA binding protein